MPKLIKIIFLSSINLFGIVVFGPVFILVSSILLVYFVKGGELQDSDGKLLFGIQNSLLGSSALALVLGYLSYFVVAHEQVYSLFLELLGIQVWSPGFTQKISFGDEKIMASGYVLKLNLVYYASIFSHALFFFLILYRLEVLKSVFARVIVSNLAVQRSKLYTQVVILGLFVYFMLYITYSLFFVSVETLNNSMRGIFIVSVIVPLAQIVASLWVLLLRSLSR